MKKKLKELRDGKSFRLSQRRGSATYILQTKKNGKAVYTSELSGRTFTKSWNTIYYPAIKKG